MIFIFQYSQSRPTFLGSRGYYLSVVENNVIWLTQDAYDKLVAELDHLKKVTRLEISAKIASAREEGDLSENGGYHAAREEQGQIESRITQLDQMLRVAQVGAAPTNSDEVSVGMQVTVAYFGDPDDTETFLLGSREMLGLDESLDVHVFSPQSPLGAAVLGRSRGDELSYATPNGKQIPITILDVQPLV